MTHPAEHWEKIARYLAGEATPAEAVDVQRWLDEHRADADFLRAVEQLGRELRAPSVDVEAALRTVKARARQPAAPRWVATRRLVRAEVLAIAATLVLAAGVFTWRALDRSAAAAVTYSTAIGQRDSVRLEDGTVVLLGPGSRIEVAANGREVHLAGTAYFRVVHDERRPFTVRAGGSMIRDIGTEFSVQSNADSAVRVVVSEGIVALSRGPDEVRLERGDVGRVTRGTRVEMQRGAATPEDLAWTRGELIFRNTPLTEVAEDLRRWQGVHLQVSDSVLWRRHFTGSFTNEPRAQVLRVLAIALGVSMEMRGDTAVLRQGPQRR